MTKLPLTLTALTTTALLALGSPALASHGGDDDNGGSGGGDDDRVIKTGSCSAGADWKLKVKTDDGRLEVEGEVDTNRSGQTWTWKIKDNGSVAARGSATTGGRSGSFRSSARSRTSPAPTRSPSLRATPARCAPARSRSDYSVRIAPLRIAPLTTGARTADAAYDDATAAATVETTARPAQVTQPGPASASAA